MCKQIFNKIVQHLSLLLSIQLYEPHQQKHYSFMTTYQCCQVVYKHNLVCIARTFLSDRKICMELSQIFAMPSMLPFLQKMCDELVCKNHTLSALLCSRCSCVVFVNSPSLPPESAFGNSRSMPYNK